MASADEKEARISLVTEDDLPELLVLMRGYCDFYEVSPGDGDLEALARALIADPEREGVQFLARDQHDGAAGFATLYWSWSTAPAGTSGRHERPVRRRGRPRRRLR